MELANGSDDRAVFDYLGGSARVEAGDFSLPHANIVPAEPSGDCVQYGGEIVNIGRVLVAAHPARDPTGDDGGQMDGLKRNAGVDR